MATKKMERESVLALQAKGKKRQGKGMGHSLGHATGSLILGHNGRPSSPIRKSPSKDTTREEGSAAAPRTPTSTATKPRRPTVDAIVEAAANMAANSTASAASGTSASNTGGGGGGGGEGAKRSPRGGGAAGNNSASSNPTTGGTTNATIAAIKDSLMTGSGDQPGRPGARRPSLLEMRGILNGKPQPTVTVAPLPVSFVSPRAMEAKEMEDFKKGWKKEKEKAKKEEERVIEIDPREEKLAAIEVMGANGPVLGEDLILSLREIILSTLLKAIPTDESVLTDRLSARKSMAILNLPYVVRTKSFARLLPPSSASASPEEATPEGGKEEAAKEKGKEKEQDKEKNADPATTGESVPNVPAQSAQSATQASESESGEVLVAEASMRSGNEKAPESTPNTVSSATLEPPSTDHAATTSGPAPAVNSIHTNESEDRKVPAVFEVVLQQPDINTIENMYSGKTVPGGLSWTSLGGRYAIKQVLVRVTVVDEWKVEEVKKRLEEERRRKQEEAERKRLQEAARKREEERLRRLEEEHQRELEEARRRELEEDVEGHEECIIVDVPEYLGDEDSHDSFNFLALDDEEYEPASKSPSSDALRSEDEGTSESAREDEDPDDELSPIEKKKRDKQRRQQERKERTRKEKGERSGTASGLLNTMRKKRRGTENEAEEKPNVEVVLASTAAWKAKSPREKLELLLLCNEGNSQGWSSDELATFLGLEGGTPGRKGQAGGEKGKEKDLRSSSGKPDKGKHGAKREH